SQPQHDQPADGTPRRTSPRSGGPRLRSRMSSATMRPKEPASDSIDAPSGAAPLTIRRLEPGDAIRDALVDLHREALPGDVLPALGKPFLKSYFESVLSDESQHVVGALVGDELV